MDNGLLKQLYLKYQKEIYLYLYSLCKNRDLAQDLMQETFLKAMLSLPNEHTNVRAWFYMVARNLYFNYQKKEKKQVTLEEFDHEMCDENTLEVLEHLLQDERRRLLYQALQHLSKDKREVLMLQYFGDLSQKEIAALLRKTPENIRILAYRGKKELREYMEANGYDIS
ncbi:MAG: RNA polymerase sigma factor [Lachnospiraceae bacterium]|nr:RNA polymerase sigma factor [Lachnospiraceae bacterium]